MLLYSPTLLRGVFDKIETIEHRFRYTYYCLQFKESMMRWLWRSRERIAMETYHPEKLLVWLHHHDYDSLERW